MGPSSTASRSTTRLGDKLGPIPPNATKEERRRGRNKQDCLVYNHLLEITRTVWHERLQLLLGHSKRRHCIVLTVIGCTRRNDQLIPQGKAMQKLKDLVVEQGFTEAPSWFLSVS